MCRGWGGLEFVARATARGNQVPQRYQCPELDWQGEELESLR